MFTYPVHQAADILFCKADVVPVGQDQLPHLEVARLVARRFSRRYGTVFPIQLPPTRPRGSSGPPSPSRKPWQRR